MSINQVAKLAGVSNSTVSRVINSHPRVAPETAKVVKAAMARLNYSPSDRRPGPKPHARSRLVNSNVVFLMLGSSRGQSTPGFERLVHGVSMGASQHGLNLTFANVPDVSQLQVHFDESRTDGIILHGAATPEVRQRFERFPAVWVMCNRRRPDWGDQVMPDTYRIGELAALHLRSRGHKHLAYLNLDASFWPFQMTSHAFATVAAEQGMKTAIVVRDREESTGYWPTHSAHAVDKLVEKFLALPEQPTGLFLADDMQAALVQPVLQRAGVKVGKGVDLVSCNNERPYLIGLNPIPHVIDTRVEAIGRRAVEQLLWRIENRSVHERFVTAIEPGLIDADGQPVDVDQLVTH
jgi:LacI family transcriptional regulator